MKIALISCSKNKIATVATAQEVYSKSILFKKTYDYCLDKKYDFIFILSAKYGILNPTDIISPYDLVLNSLSKQEREKWARRCFDILLSLGYIECQFDFYAGKIYIEDLSKLLPYSTNILKGLGIGERLRFLSK